MSERLEFTVPLIPPSVNEYKTRFRSGNTVVSDQALAFKAAVAVYAKGCYVTGKKFCVHIDVILGKKQRGDVDNFPKLVLDGLADAGVFRDAKGERMTDAHVRRMVVFVDAEVRPEQGFTDIGIEAI
jgi:Holliday junction resolvase RusA-like endonuclease